MKNLPQIKQDIDDLVKKFKIISTKGLTADMINKYSILKQNNFLQMDFKIVEQFNYLIVNF